MVKKKYIPVGLQNARYTSYNLETLLISLLQYATEVDDATYFLHGHIVPRILILPLDEYEWSSEK